MRIDRRTLLRGALGIAISVVAGWILLRSVDVGAALATLGRAEPIWVVAMVGTVAVDVGARGARWRALLSPIKHVPYRRMLGYTYLGYLANNVLPARLGELLRSHAAGEGEGLSRTTVLGTVVVERIVDTVIVVGLAGIAVVALGVGGVLATGVLLGAAFVGVLVVGLAVGIAAHRLPGAARVQALGDRSPRLASLAARLREGLAVAGRPATLGQALGYSAVAWTASISTALVAGKALGIELAPLEAALLTAGVALATIVPSGPGYLGTFELTAVSILGGFGVGREEGFALALLIHALILAVTTVGGAVAALRLGVGMPDAGRDRAPADEEAGVRR
jgi:glycosyltransferase 2 family protein